MSDSEILYLWVKCGGTMPVDEKEQQQIIRFFIEAETMAETLLIKYGL